MSLIDAMLLEPHRDRRDIWIAIRTDGAKGCGTEADPFNGGVRFDEVMQALNTQQLDFAIIRIGSRDYLTRANGGVGYDLSTQKSEDQLQTLVQDALLLSI